MKCKYHKECEGFNPNAFTCNDYTAENEYCGKYKEFEKDKEEQKKKSSLFKKTWNLLPFSKD